MNPAIVASARTARLVREAKTPTYSTSTPTAPVEREHVKTVELESDMGGRFWSAPMPESEVMGYIDTMPTGYGVSDIDCSPLCWCVISGIYFDRS